MAASPCVRNCCLDPDDICMGCGRTLDEIVSWRNLPDAEKERVLARLDVAPAKQLER